MFGGDSSNPVFPISVGENQFHYCTNVLPQLQLFDNSMAQSVVAPAGCSVGPLNYMGNEHAMDHRVTKRSREIESFSRQPKNQLTINEKLCPDGAGHSACILNPNPVSTGLRLSYEEDEHNSSITSVSENMAATLPVISSLSDNLKVEIDRQKEEFDSYIRLQEENIIKGVRELKQRHAASFLSVVEKGIGRKLLEKELEIENMNSKNKELLDRIKQVGMEVQSWHYRAKYNESVVNILKSNLQQVIAQGAMHGKEGCGDSEVDDAASYTNHNHLNFVETKHICCRACKVKEVSILLLPCRHLSLCKDCEGLIEVCPVCRVMKTASVQVYMS